MARAVLVNLPELLRRGPSRPIRLGIEHGRRRVRLDQTRANDDRQLDPDGLPLEGEDQIPTIQHGHPEIREKNARRIALVSFQKRQGFESVSRSVQLVADVAQMRFRQIEEVVAVVSD